MTNEADALLPAVPLNEARKHCVVGRIDHGTDDEKCDVKPFTQQIPD